MQLNQIGSDLPSGEKKTFTLRRSNSPKDFPSVKVANEKEYIDIETDKLKVRLPASRGNSSSYPGPVMGVTDGRGKWTGTSELVTPGKELVSVTAIPVSLGPLFAEYQIKYAFRDGAGYDVNVKCINGYDFFEIKEEINGFNESESAFWEINWNEFTPTHRQAPNRPYFQVESGSGEFGTQRDNTGFGRFDWEPIDQAIMSSPRGITYAGSDGRIPFEISTFGGWQAESEVTSTVFWDEKTKQSFGIFMQDASFWDDRLYAIWRTSGKLNVKFFYEDEKLKWVYPVYNGMRSTAMSCYDHSKDIALMDELEKLHQPQTHPIGFTYRAKMSQLSYNTFLQNRYGTIHLDRVKDWVLAYPSPLPLGPVVFDNSFSKSLEDLEKDFLYQEFILELPVSGTCQNSGYGPTRNRMFSKFYQTSGEWMQSFNHLLPYMSDKDRERFIAMFLFHSYVAAGEEYMPMRNMLSGHPNFLADVKHTPAMAAFLFPEHPEVGKWEEMFGKYVELNTRYHTRPEVTAWGAQGGRWTENLGTYVWAFLMPTIRANYLIQNYGSGRNFMAGRNTAMIGSWLLKSLSAPYDGESISFYMGENNYLDKHYWGIVTPDKGPRRVHPPLGAHSARRMPPASMWLLGQTLKNYDPLLSEYISFVSHPDDQEMEILDRKDDAFAIMYPEKDFDRGTPPDLRSMKMTGYGIILRAAVGTNEELSIHLQQIDRGPNYRWGNAADGGSGNIYFYAAGKSYSHNGKEDSGDRRIQDTDLITNFGVFKDGRFKAIGMSELSRPLYDFSIGQFAEITSSPSGKYSWPEYQGRSIMLVGSDYFIVYDDVFNQNIKTRFSWFTHPLEEIPEISILKSGGIRSNTASLEGLEFITLTGRESKGIWYDGGGDCMAFVSHKKGFSQQSTEYGGIVTAPDGRRDLIFRNDSPVKAAVDGFIFEGTAGFIRLKENGNHQMAMFHGTRIGNENFEILSSDTDAGIAAMYTGQDKINGEYSSPAESAVTFRWTKNMPENITFYLDGRKVTAIIEKNSLKVQMPPGKHIWTLTTGLPGLIRPDIDFTRNRNRSVLVAAKPVQGAGRYRFEYSADGITGWETLKEQANAELLVKPSGNEHKGFLRIIARNAEYQSQPSIVYPVYYTSEKPSYPDGLNLVMNKETATLSWGQVLGSNEYKLYRRIQGSQKYQLVYKGKENAFRDKTNISGSINEYAVTAVNGNGESKLSGWISTDPGSWLNFDPMPGEPFRKTKLPSILPSGKVNLEDRETYYPE